LELDQLLQKTFQIIQSMQVICDIYSKS